ncbi:hypothetical protein BC628DRAFT_217257 [Trametes gibbosa]|nr:hypothetical protein BC628DRAFT_217257 [Trametes gibbosa]
MRRRGLGRALQVYGCRAGRHTDPAWMDKGLLVVSRSRLFCYRPADDDAYRCTWPMLVFTSSLWLAPLSCTYCPPPSLPLAEAGAQSLSPPPYPYPILLNTVSPLHVSVSLTSFTLAPRCSRLCVSIPVSLGLEYDTMYLSRPSCVERPRSASPAGGGPASTPRLRSALELRYWSTATSDSVRVRLQSNVFTPRLASRSSPGDRGLGPCRVVSCRITRSRVRIGVLASMIVAPAPANESR